MIVGGGGIFHDFHGVDSDTFLTDNHWGVSFFSGPAVIASLWRKPVMLYAVGVGPLQSRHARDLTRIACDAAVAITVRDQAPKGALEMLGVPSERIEVTADPAFGFASTFEQPSVVDEREAPARPRVAEVVRPWQFGVNSPALGTGDGGRARQLHDKAWRKTTSSAHRSEPIAPGEHCCRNWVQHADGRHVSAGCGMFERNPRHGNRDGIDSPQNFLRQPDSSSLASCLPICTRASARSRCTYRTRLAIPDRRNSRLSLRRKLAQNPFDPSGQCAFHNQL